MEGESDSPGHWVEGCAPPGKAAAFHGECGLLVSLDYDGTLRSPQGAPIPAEFFDCVREWRPLGLRWGINTGRSLPYLLEELVPCCPCLPDFICTCERYVYMADAQGRLAPATDHNNECHRANMLLRERFCPVLHADLTALRQKLPHLVWTVAPSDPLSLETQNSADMDALIPHLRQLTPPGVVIHRAGRYLRFSDARFSKGTALRHVVQQWQVPHKHLFVMGDGQNDLDAFRLFPQAHCTAPANAHPEVISWLRERGYPVSGEPGVLPALRAWVGEYTAFLKQNPS